MPARIPGLDAGLPEMGRILQLRELPVLNPAKLSALQIWFGDCWK
jgi:hypothetical protein